MQMSELLTALHGGPFETPPWDGFLHRLRDVLRRIVPWTRKPARLPETRHLPEVVCPVRTDMKGGVQTRGPHAP